jgi:hypothetical protein
MAHAPAVSKGICVEGLELLRVGGSRDCGHVLLNLPLNFFSNAAKQRDHPPRDFVFSRATHTLDVCLERLSHFVRGLEAQGYVFLKRTVDDRREVGVDRDYVTDARHGLVHELVERLRRAFARHQATPREHLPEHDAHRKEIGSRV